MNVQIDASDAFRLAVEFQAKSIKVDRVVARQVRVWTQLLATRVKANATTGHHRPGEGHVPGTGPGPNVATGDYRRSITASFQSFASHHVGYVGTNTPQGRRLEFGFVGTDSLGRVYSQPPFPHFGPAFESIKEPFVQALAEVIDFDRYRS